MFGFWDWVGGRYSIWSAIGLPLMIAIGPERLHALPRRRARHGRPFPGRPAREEHAGDPRPDRHLVPQLLGFRPTPSCPTTSAWPVAGLPAAARHGIERQARPPAAHGRRARPAPSSSASPAPTASTPSTSSSTRGPTSVPCDFLVAAAPMSTSDQRHQSLLARQLPCAERGADARPHDRGGARRDEGAEDETPRSRGARPAQGLPGNRPSNTSSTSGSTRDARHDHRALRAQDVRPGRHLGHDRSTSGASSSARRWRRSSCPWSRARRRRSTGMSRRSG